MKRIRCFFVLTALLLVPDFSALAGQNHQQKISAEVVVELADDDPAIFSQPQDSGVLQEIWNQYGRPQIEKVFPTAKNPQKQQEKIRARFSQRSQHQPHPVKASPLNRFYKLTFAVQDGNLLQDIITRLKNSPHIKNVSPNHILKATAVPNDPYYSSSGTWGQSYADLWGLKMIQAESAWDITTGDASLIVAVVDTGLDVTHEDIVKNLYTNAGETAGNGVDDDGNGYVDDVYGYNFDSDSDNVTDDHGHGTHVAGTIAAEGDNATGIAGVMWSAQILPVKVLDSSGSGSTTDVANGIVYAADQGADIINLSLGGSGSDTLETAIQYAYSLGIVIVAAAGNDETDAATYYPAGYSEVITVASSTHEDALSSFSNYGPKIDVAAPGGDGEDEEDFENEGRNILSLRADGTDMYGESDHIVDDTYYRARGTSMAAPHVVGVVGLILSEDPTLTVEEVRQVLRQSADDIEDSGWDTLAGFGRLNAASALDVASNCEALITTPANYEVLRTRPFNFKGYAAGSDFNSYKLSMGKGMPATSFSAYGGEKTTPVSGKSLTIPSLSAVSFRPRPMGISAFWSSSPGGYMLNLKVYDSSGQLCGEDYKFFHYSPYTADISFEEDSSSYLNLGYSLAVGDINADGNDDIVIGAPGCYMSSSCATTSTEGEIYLVYGGTAGLTEDTAISDTSLVPVSWLADDSDDRLGASVATLDLDNDGYDDIVMGMPGDSRIGTTSGTVCMFLGSSHSSWSRDMDPDSADYCFYGEASDDRLGYYLSNAGDLDNDGIDDLVVSACGNDDAGTDYGKVYVLYAADASSWSTLTRIDRAAGTEITGNAAATTYCSSVYFGRGLAVSSAGDFTGDGIDDLLIGSAKSDSANGVACVFAGASAQIASGTLDDADIQFTNDLITNGGVGSGVAGIGDVNGDGVDDIALGYTGDVLGGIPSGIHIVYGDNSFSGSHALGDFDHPILTDNATYEYGYQAASALGDVDGDGVDDLVSGAFGYDGFDASGIAYLIKGDTAGHDSGIYMRTAGSILKDDEDEAAKGSFGYAIAGGDLDADGHKEIVISAPTAGTSMVYVFELD